MFKPGDSVKRINYDFGPLIVGGIYTVKVVYTDHYGQDILDLGLHGKGYLPENFSLITNNTEKSLAPPANTEGVKHDQQKPDMTDIPLEAMWEMGRAFTHGQKKYTKNNYRNGMKISRQLAAAVRHIFQHLSGETIDPESGVTHLGHALASIAMACYTIKHYPEMDDRFPKDIARHEGKNEST